MTVLEDRFKCIQKAYNKPSAQSPLDVIRNSIPPLELQDNCTPNYTLDPDLDLRDKDHSYKARWNEEFIQAKKVMPQFNRDLAVAMQQDTASKGQINVRLIKIENI